MEFYISTRRRVKLHSDVLWRALMRKPRSEYPSEQADKFLVRLPDGMRDQLAEAAKLNKRSMNAEIVARLEWSFEAGVVEEIGTDISRAMTWADHTKAMGLMVQQAAGTIRELKSEVAAMRFEMHALRQNEGLAEPQDSDARERTKPKPE